MHITPKRRPFDRKIKMGADADGKMNALAMDMLVDNGARHSIGNVIINRAPAHAVQFVSYPEYAKWGQCSPANQYQPLGQGSICEKINILTISQLFPNNWRAQAGFDSWGRLIQACPGFYVRSDAIRYKASSIGTLRAA
jgi:hypothetical protein